MLGATAVAVFGFPILAPAAIAWDLARLRRRLPTLRLYAFVLQYLVNDTIEILAAPFLWIAAGFGTRLSSPKSLQRHEQLQTWSVETLTRRAEKLLRLTVTIDETSLAAAAPGPVIVLSRHVSIFDSSLPGILCARAGLRPSGVIMAELLADPGFDLIYGRLGSVFIPRDDGTAARAAISAMTAGADEQSAFIIYPEGRLFGPARLERIMERMRTDDPLRASRLADLTHLLPPRPGGVLALLAALPEADVVLVDHEGLDAVPRLKHLATRIPADAEITVSATRIPRGEIPINPAEQVLWLDQLWLALEQKRR
jgi:1-acyl-sn-glycerol-3-phosphate acyltransferase